MRLIEVTQGTGPLVLGLPHTGTWIPDDIKSELNDTGLALADTDWHIDDLYAGLAPDATTVRTIVHRYVIDANRDPSGASLYPGKNTTGLCPLTNFAGLPIYRSGLQPDVAAITRRRIAFHAPYHAALSAELARVQAAHGFAILYDCHSIRSRIPFLFDGRLPDFNIGTNSGTTCDPTIEAAVQEVCRAADHYTSIVNGRFKGGWTTRNYGRPSEGIHAIQMELAQTTYMSESPPRAYDDDRAARLRAPIQSILKSLSNWRPQ